MFFGVRQRASHLRRKGVARVTALHADLVGPFDPDGSGEELLELAPSRWYLTGFLAPKAARETNSADDDDEPAPESYERARQGRTRSRLRWSP